MKLLMIANFSPIPGDGGNGRFSYILDHLNYSKNSAEFITSNFWHGTKKHRNIDNLKEKSKYKITLIKEPGYKKNVSLQRLLSHKILSYNLKKYLKKLDYKPDVIYCAVPSLDVANVAVRFANKNKIRFVIDIQDLWPESFKMALNIPVISDIIFFPLMRKANYIYSHSDDIIAVSQTYVDRALKVNKKVDKGLSVFLGTDLSYFDKCKKENIIKYNDSFIRIAYIGTLGTSYDLKSIIDSIKLLNNKGYKNIKFVVMGDGPLRLEFENYAKENNINYEFTGKLDYPKMVGMLCSCDIAVNPIVGKSVSSIINKVGDYAAAGLPVINTQNSSEYRQLLDEYNAGINCNNGDYKDIASKIEMLIKNKKYRKKLGDGNRQFAEDKFDRSKTYNSIIRLFDEKKVSIIVPIYNTSKYLNKCIDSILSQTYSNFELILINDGSTDNSLEICKSFERKDNRIVVIDKENTGQAETRNLGLKIAKGDYISFIDSDDWIDSRMITTLVSNLEYYDADVSACSIHLFRDGETVLVDKSKKIYKLDTKKMYKYVSKNGYGASVCNKLYKIELVKDIRFNNINIAEDSLFNKEVYKKTNFVIFQKTNLYHYYSRSDSTIHGDFKKNEFDGLLREEETINQSLSFMEKMYRKSRIPISATKVLVGVTISNVENDTSMMNYCYKLIRKNVIYTIINYDIPFLKKCFVIFCLINKPFFMKKNKSIVSICKNARSKIG